MKKILLLVLSIILASGFVSITFAAETVKERPDIRVTINGITGSYTDTPVIVNGRTLLPLRELLSNLGVPNDDSHIIWNGLEQTVTAVKGNTSIYLKVGDKSAKINNNTIMLDAFPVNYKGRVYIPAKFAAEAFDMIVAWDQITKRIYIKDQEKYKEVKTTLDQALSLMAKVKRFKVKINENYTYIHPDETTASREESSEQTDLEHYVTYYCSESELGKYESYTLNHRNYSKFSTDSHWVERILTDESFLNYFNHYTPDNLINPRDVVYAALTMEKNPSQNRTYLKGDVYALTKNAAADLSSQSHNDSYSDTGLEIQIDNTTGYIDKIIMRDKCKMSPEGMESYILDGETVYTYSDVDGNFIIKLPSDILEDRKKF